MIRKILAGALALGISATASAAIAADKVKIGVITTLTTPAAVLGEEQMNGINLAMEHLGGKMGDTEVEIIAEDDGFRPDIGKQKADKLVSQDDVDIVTGIIWSHVLLASKKSILEGGKFLIGANAGTSHVAGKECHENFFSSSWQNDMVPKALGEVLNQRGVKSLYIMAPNYAAGKDMVAGVKSSFKGEIKGEDFTKWGKDAQLDFSAELAKAAASDAEAIFVFYPGKAGGAFLKQFGQAGLADKMQFFNVFTVDGLSLPKFQAGGIKSVLGSYDTMQWSPDLDNEANKKFVADYRAKYDRYPSFYAAQTYDAINLINSAVVATGGNVKDKDAFRAELKKANYKSVRGDYSYGNNHFPIQNYYLRQVVEGPDGKWTHKTVSTVYEATGDDHAKDCPMK
uniref:ABC transporter substrate binding protein n=1 Tax=uncultured bacterium fosmid I5J7 TaxID=1701911 RepID=A0A1B0TH99_9BACT|nr:ABC transporter substrate binding protein [uncultured bacterium fosmid I5J7]